jgi:hypothetical protein
MSLEDNVNERKGIIEHLDGAVMWANNKLFDLWSKTGCERTSLQKSLYSFSLGLFFYNFFYGNLFSGIMSFLSYTGLMSADSKEETRPDSMEPTKMLKLCGLSVYALGGMLVAEGIARAISGRNDNVEIMNGIKDMSQGLSFLAYFTAVNSQRPSAGNPEKKNQNKENPDNKT